MAAYYPRGTSHAPAHRIPDGGHDRGMRLPDPRGPLSEGLCHDLATGTSLSAATVERADRVAAAGAGALADEDLQLGLAVLYELHYRGFDEVSEDWEWDPDLLRVRAGL